VVNLNDNDSAKTAEKYLTDENLTIISIILDNGTSYELATPIIIMPEGNVDFSEFEKTFTNALRKLTSPETPEINVPVKNVAAAATEPEEFKLTDSQVNKLIIVFTIVIPLILFVAAGFLGCVRKRRLAE
jgi:hypothetical protein